MRMEVRTKKGQKMEVRTRKGRERDHICVVQHCNSLVGFTLSLVPRPSITANTVEDLVKLQCKMMSGGRLEVWHFRSLSQTAIIAHSYSD